MSNAAQKGNLFLKSLAEDGDYACGKDISIKLLEVIKEHVSADLANDMLYELLAQSFDPDQSRNLKLIRVGEKKINVIKEVRAATGMGLKDSKDLVEMVQGGLPQLVSIPQHIGAHECKRAFEAAGAYVELN